MMEKTATLWKYVSNMAEKLATKDSNMTDKVSNKKAT